MFFLDPSGNALEFKASCGAILYLFYYIFTTGCSLRCYWLLLALRLPRRQRVGGGPPQGSRLQVGPAELPF